MVCPTTMKLVLFITALTSVCSQDYSERQPSRKSKDKPLAASIHDGQAILDEDCPLELSFLLDSSENARANHEQEKRFTLDVVDGLQRLRTRSGRRLSWRVAMLQYSSHVVTEQAFRDWRGTDNFKTHVANARFIGQGTFTTYAITNMTDMYQLESKESTSRSIKIAILLTDGASHPRNPAILPAITRAKNQGIRFFVVGITKAANEPANVDLLPLLASSPASRYLHNLQDVNINTTEKVLKEIEHLADELCLPDIRCACEKGERGPGGPAGKKGRPGDDGAPGLKGMKGEAGLSGHPGLAGIEGKAGYKGEQGETGECGTPGIKGDRGLEGPFGARGQRGLQGLPGPHGDMGPEGLQGKQGERGPAGPPGVQGETGFGLPGPKGDMGFQGRHGPPGPPGMGESGPPGPQGPQGVQGEKGPQGEGFPGPKGDRGLVGPRGLRGQAGAGIKGEKGEFGSLGFPGPTGLPGVGLQGEKGMEGPRGPPGTRGTPGEGLPGPKGDQGLPGEQGAHGERGIGEPGAKGEIGAAGLGGLPGLPGEDGAPGQKGEAGQPGLVGSEGPAGIGTQGEKGDQGQRGIRGLHGPPGITGPSGAKGEPGIAGRIGMPGLPGRAIAGSKGDVGPAGPSGPVGETGHGLQGQKGDRGHPGLPGPAGLKGEGFPGPVGSTGLPGFPGEQGLEGVGLPGPKGDIGFRGLPGLPGPPGEGLQGPPGNFGRPGPPGTTGAQGEGHQGPKGEPGPQGVTGYRGLPGEGLPGAKGDRGVQGERGTKGVKGDLGDHGLTGESGIPGAKGEPGLTREDIIKLIQKICGCGIKCKQRPLELVFVIDSSESVGERNFGNIKAFVTNLVDRTTIGRNATRIGLVLYSREVRLEFNLTRYTSKEDIKQAIRDMTYMGEGTYTGTAIRMATREAFRNARDRVKKVAIVITDGQSSEGEPVGLAIAVQEARANNIEMYALGMVNSTDSQKESFDRELNLIASDPDTEHVYRTDFNTLFVLEKKLVLIFCEDENGLLVNRIINGNGNGNNGHGNNGYGRENNGRNNFGNNGHGNNGYDTYHYDNEYVTYPEPEVIPPVRRTDGQSHIRGDTFLLPISADPLPAQDEEDNEGGDLDSSRVLGGSTVAAAVAPVRETSHFIEVARPVAVRPVVIPILPEVLTPDSRCNLTLDQGSCRIYTVHWYYDKQANACAQFWYGGCGGNENRFQTEDQCKNTCIRSRTAL